MATVSLFWRGPYSFSALLDHSPAWAGARGVYLWHAPFDAIAKKTVTYVGKASGSPSLLKRQRDHYASYIGGRYYIPGLFRDCGVAWVPNQYPDVKAVMVDKQAWVRLISECFEYAAQVEVFVAQLTEFENAELAGIERTLVYEMQPRINARGKSSQPLNRIEIAHENLPATVWHSTE